MSRYASKAELIQTLKQTIATDYNKLGTPLGAKSFNMAKIFRELNIIGDSYYGYTLDNTEEEFFDIIRRNVRKSASAPEVPQVVETVNGWNNEVVLTDKATGEELDMENALDVWFLFDDEEDEEPSHEANTYRDEDGFRVEWSHTGVGLVSSRIFPTREAAREWLIQGGYTDYSS